MTRRRIAIGFVLALAFAAALVHAQTTYLPNMFAGNVAHDGVDAGGPVKIGGRAVAFGTNPTGVAVGDRTDLLCTRSGQCFEIGGHPNATTRSVRVIGTDGAQTDQVVVGTSNGAKIVVTRLTVCASPTVSTAPLTVGFGGSAAPTPTLAGTTGVVWDGDAAGAIAGFCSTVGDGSAVIAVGTDGQDLRYTITDPGANAVDFVTITATYFTVES